MLYDVTLSSPRDRRPLTKKKLLPPIYGGALLGFHREFYALSTRFLPLQSLHCSRIANGWYFLCMCVCENNVYLGTLEFGELLKKLILTNKTTMLCRLLL